MMLWQHMLCESTCYKLMQDMLKILHSYFEVLKRDFHDLFEVILH